MSAATREPEQTTMRERPLLLSGPWVRALLDGHKTQTRRPMKPQPVCFDSAADGFEWKGWRWQQRPDAPTVIPESPFGRPGDRLWVREAWSPDHTAFYPHHPIVFAADYPIDIQDGKTWGDEAKNWFPFRWRPSIHMPRHVCRLVLEVESVRVERVQDISEADALAEGLVEWTNPPRAPVKYYGLNAADVWEPTAAGAFARHWDEAFGRDLSWSANPWVWVATFRKLEGRP